MRDQGVGPCPQGQQEEDLYSQFWGLLGLREEAGGWLGLLGIERREAGTTGPLPGVGVAGISKECGTEALLLLFVLLFPLL